MEAICYPVVYPRRPITDDDLVFQVLVWHRNALDWRKTAARHQGKWAASALASSRDCATMCANKLAALPAHLKSRALAKIAEHTQKQGDEVAA